MDYFMTLVKRLTAHCQPGTAVQAMHKIVEETGNTSISRSLTTT